MDHLVRYSRLFIERLEHIVGCFVSDDLIDDRNVDARSIKSSIIGRISATADFML